MLLQLINIDYYRYPKIESKIEIKNVKKITNQRFDNQSFKTFFQKTLKMRIKQSADFQKIITLKKI
ncbi:hypothetical protein B0A66_04140 [Flavobacterium hercynium]|uniref:Uncharacterized protein n=1 Tax=Flavobacterium hercynium TaxID=387094 RepID=A0A226HN32_9FLAO|nr:hypothetical protein B0A66_04140 [Flavobacterium hercynium]